MIRDIINFFIKEKLYTVIFVMVSIVLIYEHLPSGREVTRPRPSPVLEDFREAEMQLQQKVQDAGSLESFLKERPPLEIIFHLLSLFVTVAFMLGLIIDFIWIFSPNLRRRFSHHPEPSFFAGWKFSMLFKVILLFLFAGLVNGWILGFIRHTLMPWVSVNFYVLTHTTISDLLCLVFIAAILWQEKAKLRDIGFYAPNGKVWREVTVGLGAYLAVLPAFILALIVVMFIAEFLAHEPPVHPLVSVFLEEETRSPGLVAYSVLLATVIGPFFEEVFFRGFCYPVLKKRFGMIVSMVLSSAFFAWIHESTFAFWPIFVLGLGLTYVYEKRKSLIAPTILHIVHNSIFIAYFFLMKSVVTQEAGM